MAKKKYYVVWVGAKPGIYEDWDSAHAQVRGFPKAAYKSFPTRLEAVEAYAKNPPKPAAKVTLKASAGTAGSAAKSTGVITPSLSVDAACSGNPGKMEYQGVDTASKKRIFHQVFPLGTNNIGEFLAIVHALAWCQQQGWPQYPIYTDSKIAMGWIQKKQCKSTLVRNRNTEKLFDLIERAETWLANNTWTNPILKWETKRWGEIPADFGRK